MQINIPCVELGHPKDSLGGFWCRIDQTIQDEVLENGRKCSFSCWNDCVGHSYADRVSRICFLFSLRYSVMDHAHDGAVTQDHGSADSNSWTDLHFGECLLIQLKVILEGPLQGKLSLLPRLEPACLFMKFVFPALCQNPSVSVLLCISPIASQSQSKPRFCKISAKCEQAGSAWEKCNFVNKVLSLGLKYCSGRRTDLGEYYANTIKALLASVLAA